MRVRLEPVIRRLVVRTKLQGTSDVEIVGEAIDGKTQVGQNLVIDDVVQKYCVWIKSVLRKNDAVVETRVLANVDLPVVLVTITLVRSAK